MGEVGGAHWFAKSDNDTPALWGSTEVMKMEDSEAANVEGRARVSVVYRVYRSGVIAMDWAVDATECLPAPLAPGLHK